MWTFRSRNNTDLLITDNAVTTKQSETKSGNVTYRIDGLVQERRNFSALVFLAQTHRYEICCTVAVCVTRMRFNTNILLWRHLWPSSRLFTQPFIQTYITENIKALCHWPLCGEFTGDRWIPRTTGQKRGKCFHLMTSSWMPFDQCQSLRSININHSCQSISTIYSSAIVAYHTSRSIWITRQININLLSEHLLLWMLQTNVVTSIV